MQTGPAPTRSWHRPGGAALLAVCLLAAAPAGPFAAGASAVELSPAPPPRLFVRGPGAAPDGAERVETEETARLLWDAARGELVDRATAEAIAEPRDAAALEDALAKWRAAETLVAWAAARPLELRIEPDRPVHRVGDLLYLVATRPETGFEHLTVVNLASTGEVQAVFPSPAAVAAALDRFAPGDPVRRLGPAPVAPPVGADHVIALASRQRLDALHAELARLGGRRAPAELLQALARHAGDPATVRVGVAAILTRR